MSSGLRARIEADLNAARKARDRETTLVLSTTLAELKNRQIESGPLSDSDVEAVLSKAVKQRRDAAEQMRSGGREELAAKEEREAEILQRYLPEPLSDEDVRAMVAEIVDGGATAMGAVMGRLMPEIRGRFDGKRANEIVREVLGN